MFYSYRSDPEVCRYQGFDVFDEQMARRFIAEQSQMPMMAVGEWVNIGVEDRETGRLLGDVAVHQLAKNDQLVELGYTIHPAEQGRGIATEALRVLLTELFMHHAIHKVVAEVDVRNEASYRLLERLGFEREAHMREGFYDPTDEAWFDEYWYGLLARDFSPTR